VNEQPGDSTVQRGEALTLRQPSPRRRAYRLRRGDQTIGWLQFPPGRRSLALAEDEETGSLVLTASGGRVEVRGGPDAAATIATVGHALAGVAVIRTVQGPMLRWRRVGRWHRWAMEDGEVALLRFVAAHGLLRSSVRDHGPTGHPRADRGAALLDRRVPRAPSLAHRDRWRGRGRRDRGGWSGIAQQVNDLTALPSRGSPSDREEQEPTSCSGGRLSGGEDHRAEPPPICTQRSSLLPHPPTASARGLITSTF
jgi:hypothetical protein